MKEGHFPFFLIFYSVSIIIYGNSSWQKDWDKDNTNQVDLDAYKDWNVSSDKNYKAYKKECEPPWGAIVGRNDNAAEKSAKKLIELINEHLKE